MSEKPHKARADDQKDLLEQIITRELDKVGTPTRETVGPKVPPEEASAPAPTNSGERMAAADRKHRSSAVYLYLLILFGAALLLLLLAYFVQRRSNENALSDLRDSMYLSRNELLAEIRDLEETNATLNDIIAAQRGELSTVYVDNAHWREWYEKAALEASDLDDAYSSAQEGLYSWELFWELERYYQAEDYENCAAVVIRQRQGQYTYRTPDSAQERYEEIVQALIDAGVLDVDMPAI